MRRISVCVLLGCALLALVWACGGGRPVMVGNDPSVVSGRVLITPVGGATVRLVALSPAMERGDVLATTTTDSSGGFSFTVPAAQPSDVLLVASAGSYIEPSIGLGVQLGENELTFLLPDFKASGVKVSGLQVTPISTWAASLAMFHAKKDTRPTGEALAEALRHLSAHFGSVDWTKLPAEDLTVADAGVTNLSDSAREGLIVAGFSWLAKQQAETSGVSPGLVVNTATLISLLTKDAADGTFDGVSGSEALKSAKVTLTGGTLRGELVAAMTGFINSSRNASALQLTDTTAFLASVGADNDAYLFCPGQVESALCGGAAVDTEPPTLLFFKPNDGAGVAGSAQVEVHAFDDKKLKTLRFSTPASIKDAVPTFSGDGKSGVLSANLDVSSLPDGPLVLRAEVSDAAGNPAAKSVTITVNNNGPKLHIQSPLEGATLKGMVSVSVTAQAQAAGATIAKLEPVNPPAGLGADSLPSADSFSAMWDTTMAPEGIQTLTMRATDSFGIATDTSVSVVVDNIAFGTVKTVATLGAPIGGLQVKLVAIDSATGLPVVGRAGGAVLGDSGPVLTNSMTGIATFLLSQENYDGPAQLVATGAAASYVDPSDGSTIITLPSTFALSSYVAHYRAGDTLDVPLDGWTTLSDAAALAYLRGKNPARPSPTTLPAALAAVDPLFPAHLTRPIDWNLRATYPVSLTTNPQSLRDVVYAAFPDAALNRLARDVATSSGLTPGSGFGAPQMLETLRQDIQDGQFDGQAAGVQLLTGGTSPYRYDANTTRFRLAFALDEFVSSPANKTGIRRVDCQTSGLYDNISSDTSILYSQSQPPIRFDSEPPSVAFTLTFKAGDGSTMAPVGNEHLLAGTVSLVADAIDSSGVASLSVMIDGSQLSPGPGSTVGHFVATFVTGPNGAHSFTATAADRLGNSGTAGYDFVVDNTAPTITIAKPLAGFYSAAVDVAATASDAHGVLSLTATGLDGLVDVDGTPASFSAHYVFPAGPDGPKSLAFTSCDVVRNCGSASASFTLDRTPPVVAITTSVPKYTNQSTITLSGTVSDGSGAGVAKVFVLDLVGTTEATVINGVWTATASLKANNLNGITIWAQDFAVAPNSGSAVGTAPYVAKASLTSDTNLPVVSVRAPTSYSDERGMTVATDAQGRPVMPPVYSYSAGPVAVQEGSHIYKIRSKAGSADSNMPFLRWAVLKEGAPASQPSSASYKIFAVDDKPYDGPSGPLRISADAEAGYVLFEMPVNLQTLGATRGAPFGVWATFFDEAGNSITRQFRIEYTLVGAPVVAVRDDSYTTAGDANSVYAYTHINHYEALIDATKRVVRWVVYNPNQETVWVAGTHSGFSSQWREYWTEFLEDTVENYTLPDDGQSYYSYNVWSSEAPWSATWPPDDSLGECSHVLHSDVHGKVPYPCDATTEIVHYLGDTSSFLQCENRLNHLNGQGRTGPYGVHKDVPVTPGVAAFSNPQPSGGESTAAPAVTFDGSSGWSIPPATSVTAGASAMYAVQSLPARSTDGLPIARFPIVTSAAGQVFKAGWLFKMVAPNVELACQVCRGFACLTYSANYYNSGWQGYYFYRQLWSVDATYEGNLMLKTNPDYELASWSSPSSGPTLPFSVSHTR